MYNSTLTHTISNMKALVIITRLMQNSNTDIISLKQLNQDRNWRNWTAL